MELRVLFEELFAATEAIEPGAAAPVTARYPTGGFAQLPIMLV